MKGLAICMFILCLPAMSLARQGSGEIQTLKVQGNVYLLTGAGANIAVQIGDTGVLVVDTGVAEMGDKVVAAIKKLSDKPIQYVLNTHVDSDHTGGNDAVRKAGLTYVGANVTGNLTDAGVGAQIYAQDNVLKRMSAPTGVQAAIPFGSWPTQTYLSGRRQMFFNSEPIEMIHQPAAHTDGDSLIFFRRSDVVATGDIFLTTSYPIIDVDRGGSIQGEIDALNNILELAIPGYQDEGGTYIIPGHGWISDRPDVLEYRDMVTIVRDRVQVAIKKGMSLEQVEAARLTKDYDNRYSAKSGLGSAEKFIEAIYKSLTQKK
ncbi:MAG TPA: MBL fold metallo-hydrolase [Pyrinomonadaceae bacterium]|nr:MBL fold metallo-hydrolase [Pyrinomonadaceae bacterium]